MGEGMVLAPSAIASIATFPKLNRLTCHVQGALPSEASSLTALGAVQITWDERMDEGAWHWACCTLQAALVSAPAQGSAMPA